MKAQQKRIIKKSNLSIVIAAILASTSVSVLAQSATAEKPVIETGADVETDAAGTEAANKTSVVAEEKASTMDAVTVTGIRETIQSSIEAKRESMMIVDAISSEDIGNLPALSVGEAIETITGASTHREKGGASEISIRGLGPYLGNATFNGREASNGSGDRSVNFNQFPSELINDIAIYKTQQANLIEGAIAGTIAMGTVKPLDYGKRLMFGALQGNYNEYEQRVTDGDDLGYRGTLAYIDQFKIGEGELGLSLGAQRNQTNNPEEVYSSSSTWVACNADVINSSTSNCSSLTPQNYAGQNFYTAAGSHTFRQISDDDTRDAYFGAIQYKPNSDMEFNVDYQYSNRTFHEIRQDLNFSETRRGITNPVYSDDVLWSYSGNSYIESTSTDRVQEEIYQGGGINFAWQVSDDLKLLFDYAFSETERTQTDRQVRLRSDNLDIYGVAIPYVTSGGRVAYNYDKKGLVPTFTVDPRFDVNDWTLFSDDARLRRDEQYRNNEINSFRFDAEWSTNGSVITSVDAGFRFSELKYNDYDDRVEGSFSNRAQDALINETCRIDFPQSSFLTVPGNIIHSWATFDPNCQFLNYYGVADPGRNIDVTAIGNSDITENTQAAYAMFNFDSMAWGVPVYGNFGLRVVYTSVESSAVRTGLRIVENPDDTVSLVQTGEFDTINYKNNYTEFLPSLNMIFELDEDVLLRAGLYRGMTRPDPSDLSAGRNISTNNNDVQDPADAVNSIIASGNPMLEPLMSWNYDLSLEWYPNKDSILAAAIYYKQFEGGYQQVVTDEEYLIEDANGNVTSVYVPVVVDQNTGESSYIYGLELTGAYRFSSLPKPFDGLGVKASYNYAKSDYETEDLRLGTIYDALNDVTYEGIIPPANIFGLSENVFSGQLFWDLGPVELQAIYKYRSNYYQKFVGGPSQLRYVDDVSVWDFRATYNINKHFKLDFLISDAFNEPKNTYMPVQDSVREVNVYGVRYYAGIRVKF